MDTKMVLEEAVRCGRVEILENLLKENPSILADFRLKSLGDSLLHEATKFQQLRVVRELMKIDPDVAEEMDKDGFRAVDIAVIMGNLGIVKELVSVNQELCLLKGKHGRTPLHYAAIKGRVDVIDFLLDSYPDSIEALTVHAETALHLAVKNHKFDAFAALMKWVVSLTKESLINMGDDQGNTVLHLAVLTKQYECVELVLANRGTTIDVNARNEHGSTALDVLDIQDSYDVNLAHKLENVGAVRSPGSPSINVEKPSKQAKYLKRNHHPKSENHSEDWFNYFKFQMGRDSPTNTRNALLVVAVLIATVCFQAGVQPPSGILDNKATQVETPAAPPSALPQPPRTFIIGPGQASAVAALSSILGSHAISLMFLFANSLGLTASTCIILYLTTGFPFQMELHMSLYSMVFTYGFAITSILKHSDKSKQTWGYVLVSIAFTVPFVVRWLPRAWLHWRNTNAERTYIAR